MKDNKGLPTYERSVASQVTQQPDVGSTANMIINSFQRFAEGTASISQGISKQAATEQRAIIKNNISTTYRDFALTALKNPNQQEGLTGYMESHKAYSEQLLQQTDHFNKPYVSNLLDYYSGEHRVAVEKNAILQTQRRQAVDLHDLINQSIQDENDAITNSVPIINEKTGENEQFVAADALHAQTLKLIHQGAEQGFIRPDALGKGVLEANKNHEMDKVLKQYQDHVDINQGPEFIDQVRKGNIQIHGLREGDKAILIGKMVRAQTQAHTAATTALGELKTQMADHVVQVAGGAMVDQNLLHQVSSLDEKAGIEYARKINVAKISHGAAQSAYYMSPVQVANLKKEITTLDPNAPDYAEKKERADASIIAIDAQRKEMKANRYNYVLKNPALQASVNNYEQAFNAGATGTALQNTPFNSVISKPWNSIIDAELQLGFTLNGKAENRVELLDPNRVPSLINAMSTSTPEQKIELMNKLREEYGGGLPFKLVVDQLVNGGMPPQLSLLASFDPNSKEAKDVANAFSISPKDLSGELKAYDSAMNGTVAKDIGNRAIEDAYSGKSGTTAFKSFMNTTTRYGGQKDREYLSMVSATTTQLANYFAVTEGLSANKALDKAENVIGSRYDYTLIGEQEQELRMPHNLTSAALQSYAAKMESQVDTFAFNLDGTDKATARRLIHEGHWENDDVDYGLLWVDASGRTWTDKNGHPLSFSFDEARSGMPNQRIPVTKAENPVTEQGIDTGVSEAGNIDLDNRPVVKNSDGTQSTVGTITAEIDGQTVLLPTIINGKQVSNKAAISHYKKTGEHLGKFKDQQSADAYDKKMHADKGWNGPGNKWSAP